MTASAGTETTSTPVMSKAEAADLVVAARAQRGVSWTEPGAALGATRVWVTAALLGQHLSGDQARTARAVLCLGVFPTVGATSRHRNTGHLPCPARNASSPAYPSCWSI